MAENVKANVLEFLYKNQLELIGHYQKIYGLPKYPVELNNRDGQKWLKELARCIIEELAEAHGDLEEAYSCIQSNQVSNALLAKYNYNKEVSDSIHFFIELLIYAGYESWESVSGLLLNYVNQPGNESLRGLVNPSRPLKAILEVGGYLNYHNGGRQTKKLMPTMFAIGSVEANLSAPEYRGGNNLSIEVIQIHSQLLWDFTQKLMATTNALKIRDWTATERKVNTILFEELLTESIFLFGVYLDYMGFTEISIARIFEITYDKNLERIKSGY